MFGLTKWNAPSSGQTRSLFLTSAISQVYQERVLAEASAKADQICLPRMSSTRHRVSRSVDAVSATTKSLRLDTAVVRRRPVPVVPGQIPLWPSGPIATLLPLTSLFPLFRPCARVGWPGVVLVGGSQRAANNFPRAVKELYVFAHTYRGPGMYYGETCYGEHGNMGT